MDEWDRRGRVTGGGDYKGRGSMMVSLILVNIGWTGSIIHRDPESCQVGTKHRKALGGGCTAGLANSPSHGNH